MDTRLVDPDDDAYPTGVLDLPEPPVLYVRGALPRTPGIAIVGARAASDPALLFTRSLVIDLAARGFAIWSGGALGIDVAAHAAALEIGAPTVVVCGGGLAHPYPPDHAPIYERILANGGALVSRLPDQVLPGAPFFIARNHVLAAATVATVVVEAAVRSGARSTAAAARRLARPLCVVPHAPWHPTGRGCIDEILLGARIVIGADSVLAAVSSAAPIPPPVPPGPRRRRKAEPGRALASRARPTHLGDPHASRRAAAGASGDVESAARRVGDGEAAVLAVLSDQPLHVDQVCEKSGLALATAMEALLTLTLDAVVVEGPAGSFRRVCR